MKRLGSVCFLALAACAGPPEAHLAKAEPLARAAPAASASAAPSPPVRILLGQIPTTAAYRIIACSTGVQGLKREEDVWKAACDRVLEGAIGQEIDFGSGKRAKLTKAVEITDGAGEQVRAFTVDAPLDRVGVFGAGPAMKRSFKPAALPPQALKALEAKHLAIAGRAAWATSVALTAEAIDATLDGNEKTDRIVVSDLAQTAAAKSWKTRILWLSLDDGAVEPVELLPADKPEVAGIVDFDGDGRDEVLTITTESTTGKPNPIEYRYRLWHLVPGRPLAATMKRASEGWQVMAELEDHNHSDE